MKCYYFNITINSSSKQIDNIISYMYETFVKVCKSLEGKANLLSLALTLGLKFKVIWKLSEGILF